MVLKRWVWVSVFVSECVTFWLFFDYLHSVDNIKLAEKIANEQQKSNLKPKIFLQINIGNEEQKSGVSLNNLKELYELSVKDFNLNVIGLMCLPPENKDPKEYFNNVWGMSKTRQKHKNT